MNDKTKTCSQTTARRPRSCSFVQRRRFSRAQSRHPMNFERMGKLRETPRERKRQSKTRPNATNSLLPGKCSTLRQDAGEARKGQGRRATRSS